MVSSNVLQGHVKTLSRLQPNYRHPGPPNVKSAHWIVQGGPIETLNRLLSTFKASRWRAFLNMLRFIRRFETNLRWERHLKLPEWRGWAGYQHGWDIIGAGTFAGTAARLNV